MDKKFILALSSLVGTIIGAGIFAIPYTMAKSGVLLSLFYFLALGLVVLFLHLAFGEIVLRTKEKHRLLGYTEKYFGKKIRWLIIFSTIVGSVASLLAYIILGGNFLNLIFPKISPFSLSLIVWAVLSFFIILGIESISFLELLINSAFLAVVFILIFFAFPKINPSNLVLFNKYNFLFPYGIVLFSLVGWNAVPEIERILINKKSLKKIIIIAISFAVFIYLLFGLIVSLVSGPKTSQEAFSGLVPVLGSKMLILGGLFGIFSISTSFLILGNYLKNTLVFDCHIPYSLSAAIAIFVPVIFFLLRIGNFISIISFVGVFVGLIEGTMISFLWKRARKVGNRKPEYSLKQYNFLPYLVFIILLIGAIAQFIW